ncbi:MAG: orotate phosphoribosyltransferase [Defluviicoccus sp.]
MAATATRADAPVYGADPETARILLRIGAIGARRDPPFTFTSGWASPVYVDVRRLISYPAERQHVIAAAVRALGCAGLGAPFDAVAGGETAGIPYAAWLADACGLPMLYVRKQAKGFGRNARIEGDLHEGARVLLVEDLATDGASKLSFASALRDGGALVDRAFVVFFYGIFPGALATLAEAGLSLTCLATWWDVLREAEAAQAFPVPVLVEVRAFLEDPIAWSAAHGGRAAL